jgi:hypothetical protein
MIECMREIDDPDQDYIADDELAKRVCAALNQSLVTSAADAMDAERLDFLDTNVHKFRMGWQVGAAPVGNLSVRAIIMGGSPIREAIDSAMAASRNGDTEGQS